MAGEVETMPTYFLSTQERKTGGMVFLFKGESWKGSWVSKITKQRAKGGEMMRSLGSFIGGAIAGMFVFGIWPAMWQTYGVFGGWISAFIIISISWYLCHYIGVIDNKPGAATVDMAVGIAMSGTVSGMVGNGLPLVQATPTIVLAMIGGALGGLVAGMLSDSIERKSN